MGTNSKNYMKKYAQKSRQPDKVCYRCGWGIHPVTKLFQRVRPLEQKWFYVKIVWQNWKVIDSQQFKYQKFTWIFSKKWCNNIQFFESCDKSKREQNWKWKASRQKNGNPESNVVVQSLGWKKFPPFTVGKTDKTIPPNEVSLPQNP